MSAQVVEHHDQTRQPREGGQVLPATITKAEGLYVTAVIGGDSELAGHKEQFWAESGWTAWTGNFRWRLLPAEEAAAGAGEEQQ